MCFGHQIAALALGGECVKGSNGWEIGVYSNNFTKEGRYWWSDAVVPDGADKIYVEQMVSRLLCGRHSSYGAIVPT